MKTCSEDLARALNTKTEFICCDLYDLTLKSGTTYSIASFDKDVVVTGKIFRHDMFIIKREQTKVAGVPSVETLSVSISTDKNHSDIIDDVYFIKAAHDGLLDEAYLTLYRAYMDTEGNVLGVIPLFNGRCEVTGAGGIVTKLSVKSETVGLTATYPLRSFAPQNVYQESNGTVTTASTDSYTCMIPLKPSKNVLVRL